MTKYRSFGQYYMVHTTDFRYILHWSTFSLCRVAWQAFDIWWKVGKKWCEPIAECPFIVDNSNWLIDLYIGLMSNMLVARLQNNFSEPNLLCVQSNCFISRVWWGWCTKLLKGTHPNYLNITARSYKLSMRGKTMEPQG